MSKKVFLGGTWNNSVWRDRLIPLLTIDYFNPIVKDWTPECQAEEIKQREECDFVLYVITPAMTGVYSIAEAVDDSNKRPEKTIFCILSIDDNLDTDDEYLYFAKHQIKSIIATADLIKRNGAVVFSSLEGVAEYLNEK